MRVRMFPTASNDVKPLGVVRQALHRSLAVVDHALGAEAARKIGVGVTRDRRDVGAEVPGELHGGRADSTGGAVDEHRLPGARRARSRR